MRKPLHACARLLLLAFLLLPVACADTGEEAGDPVSVAKKALLLTLAYDHEGLSKLACEPLRRDLAAEREAFEETKDILEGLGVDVSKVRYDTSALRYELVERDEYTATVRVSGILTVHIPGRPEESQDQNQEIDLRFEEGRWLVCSEIYL